MCERWDGPRPYCSMKYVCVILLCWLCSICNNEVCFVSRGDMRTDRRSDELASMIDERERERERAAVVKASTFTATTKATPSANGMSIKHWRHHYHRHCHRRNSGQYIISNDVPHLTDRSAFNGDRQPSYNKTQLSCVATIDITDDLYSTVLLCNVCNCRHGNTASYHIGSGLGKTSLCI